MNDLISKKSVKNAIYKVCLSEGNKDIFVKILDEINKLSFIEQEPTDDYFRKMAGVVISQLRTDRDRLEDKLAKLEQEPKTGHWDIRTCKCSECGYQIAFSEYAERKYKYCPNCGAKMVEP